MDKNQAKEIFDRLQMAILIYYYKKNPTGVFKKPRRMYGTERYIPHIQLPRVRILFYSVGDTDL